MGDFKHLYGQSCTFFHYTRAKIPSVFSWLLHYYCFNSLFPLWLAFELGIFIISLLTL